MAKLTSEQLAQIKEKAEGYKKDMVAFIRNIVKYPGESCGEKEHVKVIENEMKKVGFDEVIVLAIVIIGHLIHMRALKMIIK